jgi:hypothetical protein
VGDRPEAEERSGWTSLDLVFISITVRSWVATSLQTSD